MPRLTLTVLPRPLKPTIPTLALWGALIGFAGTDPIAARAQMAGAVPDFTIAPAQVDNGPPLTWLGGDVGRMIVLDGNRTLWFFSDAYIGPVGARDRRAAFPKVVNTVALGEVVPGAFPPFRIQHLVKSARNGSPRHFFEDPLGGKINPETGKPFDTKFWAFKPIVVRGVLYVFLNRIVGLSSTKWETKTSVIARVRNYRDHPFRWNIEYIDLYRDANPAFGYEAVEDGKHLVIYGTMKDRGIKTIAVRVPIDVLERIPAGETLEGVVEYMNTGYHWTRPDRSGPKPSVIDGIANCWDADIPSTAGFSVRYNPGLKRWQAVYLDTFTGWPCGVPKVVQAKISKPGAGPLGPWEPPAEIYRLPELDPESAVFRPDAFGYMTHEVPEFSHDPTRRIMFTYCNSFAPCSKVAPEWHRTDLNYYRVRAVEVKNPFAR